MFPGTAADLEDRLARLETPVRLVFFSQTFGCDTCLQARQVVDQIASVSDRITVEEHNLVLDKEQAEAYGVDRAPALAIVGATDLGIRYYGVPGALELGPIVEAIQWAGAAGDDVESGAPPETAAGSLTAETRGKLATLDRALDLKVFVTPT